MTDTLFPELQSTPAIPAARLSADRRRTKRQKTMLANGIHPVTRLKLTETLDATCGNCQLRRMFGKYAKCTYLAPEGKPAAGPYVTSSAATDIRSWWPACARWTAKDAA